MTGRSKSKKSVVDGGQPLRSIPLPSWPYYSEEEIEAATRILRSGKVNYWTGTECREFEKEFAEYHGVRYAVALANGTLALELALKVLGIGPGDEVIVTPRSYFASVSCVVLAGATPVFADVDLDSQNMTPESIREVLTPRTRAIIPVHLAGWPCDMPAIMEIADRHNLYVIEDCAQAHGARIDGKLVGSFGHLAAFSFCQDKIMTTAGEGGMLLTNRKEHWSAAWSYKDHGKNYEKVHATDHPPGFRWLHDSFGSNWRMTEIQGAIGRIQLRRLDDWIALRTQNAAILRDAFSALAMLRIPAAPETVRHAYYKFYAFLVPELTPVGWDRDSILIALQSEGLPGLSGACSEIYKEGAFSQFTSNSCPRAEELGHTSIMMPVHPTLTQEHTRVLGGRVASVLAGSLGVA